MNHALLNPLNDIAERIRVCSRKILATCETFDAVKIQVDELWECSGVVQGLSNINENFPPPLLPDFSGIIEPIAYSKNLAKQSHEIDHCVYPLAPRKTVRKLFSEYMAYLGPR